MIGLQKLSWRSFDWPLFIATMLLCAVGMAAVYSIDLSRGVELIYLRKQLIAFGIGFVLLFLAAFTQYSFFRAHAKIFYGFCLLLLVAVLIFGRNIRGTTGWFNLGGFSFQPVELAKLGVIVILSYIISNFGRRFERPLFFFGTMVITGLAMGLVMLQPDFGSAVILGSIWFGLMLLVGARKKFIVGLLVAGVIGAIFAWFFLFQDYQKERVLTFIDPSRDALDSGYNITQAMIAIGSGQWWGRGLGFGSQSQLRFLPEAQTDFVFSAIGEELGFAGALFTVMLFVVVLWRLLVIVKRTDDDFAASIASGIAIVLFAQFTINVGANLGLLPITGVTLPFVSYGGSSLMINLLMIGVAESLVVKRY